MLLGRTVDLVARHPLFIWSQIIYLAFILLFYVRKIEFLRSSQISLFLYYTKNDYFECLEFLKNVSPGPGGQLHQTCGLSNTSRKEGSRKQVVFFNGGCKQRDNYAVF